MVKRERRGVNQDFGEIFAMVCILRILVLRSLRRTVFSSLFCLFSLFCVPRLARSLYFHDLNFSNPGIFFFFFVLRVILRFLILYRSYRRQLACDPFSCSRIFQPLGVGISSKIYGHCSPSR